MNYIIKLLISLPVLFFLPGYLFATYWFRAKKKDTKVTFSHFIFISLVGSFILTSWLGLILAELSFFSLNSLIIILWLICLVGAALNKFKFKPERIYHPKLSFTFFVLIAILTFAGYLFLQPHELILGGRDPGVYINTGINIAKSGGIVVQNEPLSLLSEGDKIEFAKHFNENFMMGFYLEDLQKAQVMPQFFHLFSLWYGIFYSLFGLKFILYMPSLFAIISLWAVYLFAQKIFNSEKIAIIATALLSINIIQIWFARYADSEIMGQFLLFSGFYLFSLFMDNHDRIAGLLSGLCLGLAFLLKVDLLLIIMPFLLFFGYELLASKFKLIYLYFLIPLLFLFSHGIVHSFLFCRTYMHDAFWAMFWEQMPILKISAIVAIVVIILLSVWRGFRIRFISFFTKKGLLSKLALVLAACLIFYGYYVRPDLLSAPTDINTHSFRWMGWFLHPAGLLLAIGGFLLAIHRCRNSACFIWIFLVSLYSIQYFYKIRAFPDYFWLMRRFVPLIYPSAIIFISYLVASSSKILLTKYKKLVVLPYLIIFLLAVSYLYSDFTTLKVREFEGATEFVEKISMELEGKSLIICQGPSGDLVHLISLPLWSISSQDMIELRRPIFNPTEIAPLISTWMSRYDSIYLLTSKNVKLVEDKYYWGLIDEHRFRAPFMKYTYERPPKEITYVNINLILRKLLTPDQFNPLVDFIDIGEKNDLQIKSGFYNKESTAEENFRWSKGEAVIYLPALSSQSKQLIIRMSGGRPEGVAAAQIQLYINGKKFNEMELENSFKIYPIPLPVDLTMELESLFPSCLMIKSNIFIPAVEMGTADTRELGIMLDYIAVK